MKIMEDEKQKKKISRGIKTFTINNVGVGGIGKKLYPARRRVARSTGATRPASCRYF